MDKKNLQYTQERNKAKKRHGFKMVIPIILLLVAVFVFCWKIGLKKNLNSVPIENQYSTTVTGNTKNENDNSPAVQSVNNGLPWNLVLVNKWNPLPENYEIELVKLPGGEKVDRRIYEPLMEMLEAAKDANWNQLPKIVSGYRTQQTQQELYDEKVSEYKKEGYSDEEAIEQAEQWVAVPGCSEHQLGIAVDINGATYDLYFWLQENSYKYGFIFRYPAGKTDITGTAEEVWHYRYVGVEAATEIYESGVCLEEYLNKLEK